MKMFFVALCLLLITFTGCGDTEWWNKFKESVGLPVTYTSRYPKGTIKSQRTYCKGELCGTSKEYYEDGQIKGIVNYKNNVFHGEMWGYSERGQLEIRCTFKYGARDGPCALFDFDRPGTVTEGIYKDDVLISSSLSERNGRLISTSRHEYKDGKLKKETTTYAKDNSTDVTELYNNRETSKYISTYDSDGHLVRRRGYDVSGNVINITKPEGEFSVVYDSSEKQVIGKWDKDGNYYNANGKKIGHAGPDGTLILEEQPSSNQMKTRKSK